MATFLLYFNIFLTLFTLTTCNQLLQQARNAHVSQEFNDDQLQYLTELSNVENLEDVLDNLLIPRVVNTSNHEKVHLYIINKLRNLGWNMEVDRFKEKTPKFGTLTFKNIVASLNPSASRYLVLACHYDSKYFKDIEFVGATDSAVPCAMLINLAKTMKSDLDKHKSNTDVSLKLVFFDGEEAFVRWGPQDSIYGAKHLASVWENNIQLRDDNSASDLNRVDVMVLLDLLGASNPTFQCYFEDTKRLYLRLLIAENRLANLDLLSDYNRRKPYFQNVLSSSFIEDDHIPFMQRGVPILHLIPSPFPRVWHTEKDNRDIIDISTVENLNKILRVFVAEYLHLLDDIEDTNHVEL